LIGALVDREVRRLELRNGKVVREEALFSELDARIRDVRVFDGEIFLLTDAEQGRLLRVRPRRQAGRQAGR
jgi:glucose/arabinose dehydrogenase